MFWALIFVVWEDDYSEPFKGIEGAERGPAPQMAREQQLEIEKVTLYIIKIFSSYYRKY